MQSGLTFGILSPDKEYEALTIYILNRGDIIKKNDRMIVWLNIGKTIGTTQVPTPSSNTRKPMLKSDPFEMKASLFICRSDK